MEGLFAALSSPARLWVIQYLASHGPTRQADLAREFAKTGLSCSPEVNPGAMSQIVRPLITLGLIGRTGARGPLQLQYEQQTGQLLSTASALMVATTADSHSAADRGHAGLMRDLTAAVRTTYELSGTSATGEAVRP
jgi:hypothetical protein